MNEDELCAKAGIDPDEKITEFVMADLASALIGAGWEDEDICLVLATVRPSKLANTFCEASHWAEVFEIYADDIRHDLQHDQNSS